MTFNEKTAIVTGAGSGIGFEICRSLVQKGAAVILNDLDPDLAQEACSKITDETGGRCLAISGNSADQDVINRMINKAVQDFGSVDIAIANAGITLWGDFLSYKSDDFYRLLQVNLGGSFFLTQSAARRMKEQKKGGSILFTSSVTGHQAHKNLVAYGMTKAALEMLAKGLVIELSQYGINVNAVAPGATVTERTLKEEPEYEKVWSKLNPTGRPGYPPDVAGAALFLVSDLARQITGQTLVVDGGWSCISPSPFEED